MSNPPLRRRTKSKSINPAAITKAALFLLSIGLFLHILFLNFLVILLGQSEIYIIGNLVVTGIPELDMLIPILTLFLLPVLQITTDPVLSILLLLPWVVAGFLTGYQFGPNHENAIFFSFPYLLGTIGAVGLLSFISILGIGTLFAPSMEIIFLLIFIMFAFISMASIIGMISLFFIVPSFIGYYFGRRLAPKVYPLMFYAQPNRIDPDNTKCQFLTKHNTCGVSRRPFIPNTCDNRFNQVTCPQYLRMVKPVDKKNPLGGLLSEKTH